MQNNKILVLGASGMLGHKVFEVLSEKGKWDVLGVVRSKKSLGPSFPHELEGKIVDNISAENFEIVARLLVKEKPEVVINCIGIIKQKEKGEDSYKMILLNSLFPHQVAEVCRQIGARFITISTDCIFDGQKGSEYLETDLPTCHDVYGMTKYLGEVKGKNSLTLRTSLIGHELRSNLSLLDWFLSQRGDSVKGYTNAIFSGFTTLEFANLLAGKIIPDKRLAGLYQISVNPISKYDLLKIIARNYRKKITIKPDSKIVINRSLNSDRLKKRINYSQPDWENLIYSMHKDFLKSAFYKHKRGKYEKQNFF
jgi:dTDP-4-dehydrorhamnose reductase